ncbi:universal stress protein [Natrinema gari]|uniref:UspA domain-containing protein n=1 Tax=Natrinema gari JCM 14663 TaxID=1230459 RepID=L9Z364_9EURY|nr:universal stress protein [Natrinema gari]ELY79603.1 UspA domain-containing protein [Natrinema gari JCM 14663]
MPVVFAVADLETNYGSVVEGNEGKAGVSRLLLGSVVEAVTRRVEGPMTIVP